MFSGSAPAGLLNGFFATGLYRLSPAYKIHAVLLTQTSMLVTAPNDVTGDWSLPRVVGTTASVYV